MREFKPIVSLGCDQYEVTTIKDVKDKKTGKMVKVEDTYLVDLRIGYCQCPDWYYNHKKNVKDCPHYREVISQLRDKGHCIVWNKKEKAHYDLGLIKEKLPPL